MTGLITSGELGRRLRRPAYDRAKLLTDEGRNIMRWALDQYCPPEWGVHVDRHCQHFQEYLTDILQRYFPAPRKGPRATYIPEATWRLREAKMGFKARVRHRRRFWAEAVAGAFRQWADVADCCVEDRICKHGLLYQLASTAIGWATWRIRQGINHGKNEFLRGFAGDGAQGVAQVLQRLRQSGLGGRTGRKVVRPLPLLLKPNGEAAQSRKERDEVWLAHFGEQESGFTLPVGDFLSLCSTSCPGAKDICWDVAPLPTISAITDALRQIPRGKAMGLDGVPAEALLSAPVQMAAALHPLFTKAMLHMRQPVQWRGGVLYAAYKNHGPASLPENFRSLFVSSTVGKTYHKLLRSTAQPQLQRALHGLHLGSKRQAPLTYAALYLQSHFRSCHRKRWSVGALFLDLKAAYYGVVREIVTGDITHDDTVTRVFARFGLSGEDLRHMMEIVVNGGLMTEAAVHPMVVGAVRDIHFKTWFVSQYSDGRHLAATEAGSRPGESWADAIFAYLFSRILDTVAEIADGEGLFEHLYHDNEAGPFSEPGAGLPVLAREAVWADDAVFPFADPCPMRMMTKATRLASIIISTCESHGLTPNLRRGKTSFVLHLVGKGKNKAREHYFAHGQAALYLTDLDVWVPVVAQYVHLGGVVEAAGSMRGEARRRLALLNGAYDMGKKLVFQNKRIVLATSARMFEIAVLPTAFNLAIWLPDGNAWHQLCDGYARTVRRMLAPMVPEGQMYRVPLTFVHLLTNCWRLPLVAMQQRLSLLCSMVAMAPDLLWAGLQEEQGWLRAVRKDLAILHEEDGTFPGPTEAEWPLWSAQLRRRDSFKYRVKKILRKLHARENQRELVKVGLWAMHRYAVEQLPLGRSDDDRWACRSCCKGFASKAGLSVHFFKCHQRVARYRACLLGTLCQACGKEFWAQHRLAAHLQASPHCVDTLHAAGLWTQEPPPGHGSRQWHKRKNAEYNLTPVTALQLPLQPGEERWSREASEAYRVICDEVSGGDGGRTSAELQGALVRGLCSQPLYPEEEVQVMEQLRADLSLVAKDPELIEDYRNLLTLTADVRAFLYYEVKGTESGRNKGDTFKEFNQIVDGYDWTALLRRCQRECVTHAHVLLDLTTGWEVADPVTSGTWKSTTTLIEPRSVVPVAIWTAWSQAIQAKTAEVRAPEAFWATPLAAPFRALRETCKPTN